MSKTKTAEEAPYMTTFDTPFYSLARQINDDPSGEAGCRLELYMNGRTTIYGSNPGDLMNNVINHYVACISINESVVNDIVDTIMSDIARTVNQLIGDNSNAKDLSAGDTLGTISYNVHNFSYNKKNGECECLLTITFGAKDHPAAVEFSRAIKWKNEGELTHRVPEVVGTLAAAFNQYRSILWSIFTSVGQLAHIPFNFKPFVQLNPTGTMSESVGPFGNPLVGPCIWPQQNGIQILTAPDGSNGK